MTVSHKQARQGFKEMGLSDQWDALRAETDPQRARELRDALAIAFQAHRFDPKFAKYFSD